MLVRRRRRPYVVWEMAAEDFLHAATVLAEGRGYADIMRVGEGWSGYVEANCFLAAPYLGPG